MGPKTGVLFAGWLLTMSTLVSVTLPALLTMPEKTSGRPGSTGPGGQNLLTEIADTMVFEHVAEQLERLVCMYGPVPRSVPLTNIVSVIGAHILALE